MTAELQKQDVDQFIALIFQGTEAFLRAGELAAQAIQRNPKFVDQVCDACRYITPEFVKRMEAVGLRKLRPQWVINQGPGARRIARLPYDIQTKHETQPVELVIEGGELLLVDVLNLTPDQSMQVFADDHVRTLAEQRAFLEDRRAKRLPQVRQTGPTYEIKKGFARFHGDMELPWEEIMQIALKAKEAK